MVNDFVEASARRALSSLKASGGLEFFAPAAGTPGGVIFDRRSRSPRLGPAGKFSIGDEPWAGTIPNRGREINNQNQISGGGFTPFIWSKSRSGRMGQSAYTRHSVHVCSIILKGVKGEDRKYYYYYYYYI